MLWAVLALSAATVQVVRTAFQRQLVKSFSPIEVTWARYAPGLPVAFLAYWGLDYYFEHLEKSEFSYLPLTVTDVKLFYGGLLCASFTQISATILLLKMFHTRNFAIGITYKSTEALQTAIIGMIFFGYPLSSVSFACIFLGFLGVLLISIMGNHFSIKSILKGLSQKSARMGLFSGTLFSLSALLIKNASNFLSPHYASLQACWILVVMISFQTAGLTLLLYLQKDVDFKKSLRSIRSIGITGLTSVVGPICWSTAFLMTNPAYVKAVGQIEVLFSLAISYGIFKENVTKHETIGSIIVVSSIVLLMVI